MAIAERTAEATWEGALASGNLQEAVSEAADLCPVSRLGAGAKIRISAPVEPAP